MHSEEDAVAPVPSLWSLTRSFVCTPHFRNLSQSRVRRCLKE